MKKQVIDSLITVLIFLVFAGPAEAAVPAKKLTDESETENTQRSRAFKSYDEALKNWKTAEDVSRWIGSNFKYDMKWALSLSESKKSKKERPPIYSPADFFKIRSGMCVDLSRFGFETLTKIDPSLNPKYMMIEFSPIKIKNNVLRRHWMTAFLKNGKYFFFADSKRPGRIFGPYNSPDDFIVKYEGYRKRKIVSYKLLDSFKKRKRKSKDRK